MLKLSIQDSEGKSHIVPLTDGELSIGRDEANSICLSDRNVSRQHARLTTKNGHVYVENVAATWGTRYNSLLLKERAEIQQGDVIQVGDYVLELVPDGSKKRDNAIVDAPAAPAPKAPAKLESKNASTTKNASVANVGKGLEGGTAMINLADIQSGMSAEAAGPSTAIAEGAQPRLVVESENLRGLELRITKTPIVVGRVREASDLVVDHRSISKEHARLTRQNDGTWQILDLGSANGIKVNGEPYSKCDVRSGDRIEFGHVTMRFLAAGARASSVGNAEGGKSGKGMMIGIIAAAVVVLAVIIGFFATRGGDKAKDPENSTPKVGDDDKKPSVGDKDNAAKAVDDKGDKPVKVAKAPEAPSEPASDPADVVQQADKLAKGGLYEEALTVLNQGKGRFAGNPVIELKLKQVQNESDASKKLDTADRALENDPKGALKLANEAKAMLKDGTPLADRADKIAEAAKAASAPAAPEKPTHEAVAIPAKPKPEHVKVDKPVEEKKAAKPPEEKKVAPPPEEKKAPPPVDAPKSGADLYKDGRQALLDGKSDEAIALFKQALAKGNGKAHGQLARIYSQKSDKANCAKSAKAYLDKYPDAADAQQIQGLLDRCSN